VYARLASLCLGAWLWFVRIQQTDSNSVHGDCGVGQMTKALLIFLIVTSPAAANDGTSTISIR
jgi:hypothetical protein